MSAPVARLSAAELEQRRVTARRMAWAIGTAVMALYIAGFFFERG